MSFAEEITEIFHSSLGIDPPGPDVDLIALGLLDSLSIVGLVTALESRYNVQIPLEQIDLNSIRTTRGIQELIESERRQETTRASPLLVLIRSGSGRPVFLPHNSHGSAATAQPLARVLRTDRPIYAFQAEYFTSGAAPGLTLERMASTYIRELRNVQPIGPYSLAGHSFAGLIAYEMARQLSDAGDTVDLLAMVDTQADAGLLSGWARIWFSATLPLRRALYMLENPSVRMPELSGVLRAKISGRNTADAYNPRLSDDVRRAVAISDGMEATYRPSPYDGDAVLLVAARRHPSKCSPEKIWRTHVRGTLRTEPIPGAHGPVQPDAWNVVGDLLSPLLG